MHRRIGASLLAVWIAVFAFAGANCAAEPRANAGQFVVIGDFHFDPFDGLSPEQFRELASSPTGRWPELLAKQPAIAYGRDSSYALLRSSLDDLQGRYPALDFILCPGDFLAHGWQPKYDRLAARSRRDDPQAFEEFTAGVIGFMAGMIAERFPNTAFLPVLGNDDAYCGDYNIAPDSPFQAMFAATFEPLLRIPADSDDARAFRESCPRGGCYSLRLPGMNGHRLAALNTVFFSTQYSNDCGSPESTPALDQLRWLDSTLDAAEAAGEAIWLLMHIPPGIDGYSSNKEFKQEGNGVAFWQPEVMAKFLRLVRRYRMTIQMSFAGHTHMDDFRVISLDGQPALLTKIAPAVSPIFANNPGYQAYRCDRATGVIDDYRTIHLPLGATIPPASALWTAEYEFAQAYRLSPLRAAGVIELARAIEFDGPMQRQYRQFYSVGGAPTGITTPILRCAMVNATIGEFNECLKRTAAEGTPRRVATDDAKKETKNPTTDANE